MTAVIVVADTHVNSTVGLCPPSVSLDDGGTYHASRGQRWLWECWQKLIETVKPLAPFILVSNGDAVEYDQFHSRQTITRNKATILRMAADVWDPLVKLSSSFYVVRGTQVHTGKSAEYEESFARDFGAVKCPETKTWSWWSLPLEVERVKLDIRHATTNGGLPWTAKYSALRCAARAEFEAVEAGEPLPDLVIRSHVHKYQDSHDAYRVRAVYTPAWQLATSYVHSLASCTPSDIGGIILYCDKSRYEVQSLLYKPERRKWVKG